MARFTLQLKNFKSHQPIKKCRGKWSNLLDVLFFNAQFRKIVTKLWPNTGGIDNPEEQLIQSHHCSFAG